MMDRCPSCGGEALSADYAHKWGCSVLMGASYAAPVTAPTGWRCLGCNRVLAPHVNECPHCQPPAGTPGDTHG